MTMEAQTKQRQEQAETHSPGPAIVNGFRLATVGPEYAAIDSVTGREAIRSQNLHWLVDWALDQKHEVRR